MDLQFQEYRPRKLVNVHRHVDGPWFWTKYSAHPYVGCRSGCEFCYLRGGQYQGRRDPNTFDTLIQVKIDAVAQLRAELFGLQPDVIACGDWQQPAEDRYRLSRGMLEVVRDFAFPLFIVERSPLVTRDLDLLIEINQRAWVGAVFSLSNLDNKLKQAFEPRSPGLKRRLQAMAELASTGILVGATLMPIIPFVGDDRAHLEEVVRATKDHGGAFVLAGGMTMAGVQAQRTFAAAQRLNPEFEMRWRQFYKLAGNGQPNYSPPREYSAKLGLLVRELCERHGLKDRMPRYIGSGPLAVNKQIAEKLFLKTYDLELEQAQTYRIWAYRKAAWTIDEWPESVAEIYRQHGETGLQKLPGIGKGLATEIFELMTL
jgi:DNA repair photolyase